MVQSRVPLSTEEPLVVATEVMVPSWGAIISFSIFMASRIISTSPDLTAWPAVTFTSRMVPGMGAVICSPAPAAGAGAGSRGRGGSGSGRGSRHGSGGSAALNFFYGNFVSSTIDIDIILSHNWIPSLLK